MALTLKKIAKLPVGRHHDRHGLYLKVTPNGGSWLLRYQRDHAKHWHGLGPLKDFGLEEARERARKARQQLRDGIDPIGLKREQTAIRKLEAARAVTFESAAKQYFDQHERKWSNARHRQQFLNSLAQYVFPTLGATPVAMIGTPEVLSVLEPIWSTHFVTATRVRARIESVLNWSTIRGFRTGDNPAAWKNHLALLLPAKGEIARVVHHKALPFEEMPTFMAALAKQPGIDARALEFLILCASRTSEVLRARWSEIDLKGKVWTIPPERMKARKPHRVALSDRAVKLLKALPRESGDDALVFIGARAGTGLGDTTLWLLLKSMGVVDKATPHGMRASFRTWASECTAFPRETIEGALAHVVGSEAERAYLRSDQIEKRRLLMQAWSDYVSSPARKSGDVVPIRKKRGTS
jgi:integrase